VKLHAYCSSGLRLIVTVLKIAGLKYWVLLLFNFAPVNVRQV